MITLPTRFIERMTALLGGEADAFFASFDTEPVRSLRWNTLKGEDRLTETASFPTAPLPYRPHGYTFENDRIGSTWLHRAGAIYVQEPAAMTPVSCVEIAPGSRVLDLCAAPGGKSGQLAALLAGTGVLVSNEYVTDRCRVLAQNLERLGVRNAAVTNLPPAAVADRYPGFFDLTVVDAPCSGEGMMRKNPLAISEWSEENVLMCAARQKEILAEAVRTVAPGGRLLYSTCTFSVEENEENVVFLLENFPDLTLVPVKKEVADGTSPGIPTPDHPELILCRRCYPHKTPGEGQFVALFQRAGEREPGPLPSARASGKKKDRGRGRTDRGGNAEEEALFRAFLSDVLTAGAPDAVSSFRLLPVGEGWCLSPDLPLPENGLFVPGVRVGEARKGRVIPHHWFFSAYGKDFKRKIDLSPGDPRLAAYLRGEEISAEGASCGDGYAAVCVCGIPLGGAHVSGGRAKNLYPKGLRGETE